MYLGLLDKSGEIGTNFVYIFVYIRKDMLGTLDIRLLTFGTMKKVLKFCACKSRVCFPNIMIKKNMRIQCVRTKALRICENYVDRRYKLLHIDIVN